MRDDEEDWVQAGLTTDARRRRRTAAVIALLAAVFALLVVVGVAVNRGWVAGGLTQAPASATPACTTSTPALSPPAVTVNVYNGTDTAGLAGGASSALDWQGFRVGSVRNDPLGKKVGGVGEVRHGPQGAEAAMLVASRVPGVTLVEDSRPDGSVDLVVGAGFTAVPRHTHTPTRTC